MKNLLILLVISLALTNSFKYKKKSQQKHKLLKKFSLRSKEGGTEELAAIAMKISDMEGTIGKVEYINFDSFRQLFRNRGMIPGEIQFLFNTVDRNKNNKLNQPEW